MSCKVTVRQILPSDADLVMQFTKELAEHLNFPATQNRDQMYEHLKAKLFSGFLAFVNDEPAGMLTFSITYSSWNGPFVHVEDAYVRPKFRNQKITIWLSAEMIKFAHDHDLQRIEADTQSTNTRVLELHRQFGAVNVTQEEGWQRQRIDRKGIEKYSTLAEKLRSKL